MLISENSNAIAADDDCCPRWSCCWTGVQGYEGLSSQRPPHDHQLVIVLKGAVAISAFCTSCLSSGE